MSKVSDYSEARIQNVKNYNKTTTDGLIKIEFNVPEDNYIAEGTLSGAGVAFAGAIGVIALTITTGGMAGLIIAAGVQCWAAPRSWNGNRGGKR